MTNFINENRLQIDCFNQLDDAIGLISRQCNYDTGAIVYLTGDLGSGKTTFAQHWLRQLGVTGAIPSPTYTLVNEYMSNQGHCIHADLYRLSDPEELLYLDVREWRDSACLILIEWPEKGEGYLPEPDIRCHLALKDDSRTLLWQTSK